MRRYVEKRLEELKRSREFREDVALIRKEIARAKRRFLSLTKDGDATQVSAKRVSKMFENGSLNYSDVAIDVENHDWFIEKYGIYLYVDPDHDHPVGFDPFQPPVVYLSGGEGHEMETIMIDKKTPAKIIAKEIAEWRRRGRQSRHHDVYPDDKVRKVKDLMSKGLRPLEIFQRTHPEFKWFHPSRDYYDFVKPQARPEDEGKDRRTLHDFEAYNAYQKHLRLIKILKKPAR